jgi:Mce-associated membrane protein
VTATRADDLAIAAVSAEDETSGGQSREETVDAQPDDAAGASTDQHPPISGRVAWSKIAVYGLLPFLAMALTTGSGYLKFHDMTMRDSLVAQTESAEAAKEGTAAILSYRADSVEQDLNSARDRLTGQFQDAYSGLIRDVVIPGSKQRHITAVATVPAVAPVSATSNHAVVLVFVDQTVTLGNDPPTETASSVRVTLDDVSGRWLISGFDPI